MNVPPSPCNPEEDPQQTIASLREALLRLEAQLDASGARYEGLKRLLPVGFCSVREDGVLLHASPSAAILLGLPTDALLQQPISRFIAPQDRDAYDDMRSRLIATGEPQSRELRMQQGDTTQLWARLVLALAPEPRRGVQLHLSISNITRQKQAQSALEHSEERFRRLTELSSDWYWEQDVGFRFVQITGGDSAAEGGPAATFLGSSLWEITAIRRPQDGWTSHRAMVKAQLPFHDVELQLDDIAGRACWMSISGVPFFGDGGAFLGYRGIGRDISAEKRAATARQEALDRLQKIASRLPGMVYQYRLRSDGSACYPFVSDAIRDLMGLTPEAVREDSTPAIDIIHPDDVDRVRAATRKSAQDLSPWQLEYRIRRADGSQSWLLGNAVPEREPGGSTLWNGFVTDITTRKLEQELVRTALREKSALLQEVHHRVKNNLQVVVSLLRLEARRSTHDAAKAVLDDMQGRIRAMALLHESLYRADVFASVRLEHYLRELATQAFRAVGYGDNLVRLDLDLAPVKVALHQATPCGLIVNELISNCFKHGFPEGRGGVVNIRLEPVPGSQWVRLQVSDSGAGFPPEFAAPEGRSLGLQLVSDLSRQLGGTLEIGPGSAVTLSFAPEEPTLPDKVGT